MPVAKIDQFKDEFRFLSNFWPAVVRLPDDEFPDEYGSVEHAFQAAKSLNSKERKAIREAPTPGKAKRWGREVTLRPGWEDIKVNVMRGLLWIKFNEDPRLRAKLLATEEIELVEGNTWGDRFWGVDLKTGVGENHLGKLLVETRDKIRENQVAVLYAKRVAPELDLFEDMLKRAKIQFKKSVDGEEIDFEIQGSSGEIDATFNKNGNLIRMSGYEG